MLKTLIGAAAIASFALCTTDAALADACSGHDHVGGTVLGGVTGGVVGGAITHGSPVGVVCGAVVGGLAGNAIARSGDCNRHAHYYHNHRYASYYTDRYGHRHYYNSAYER